MKLNINLTGIPPELKQLDQWILWRKTEPKKGGRFGKQPISAAGYVISATAPKNWHPFNTAVTQLNSSTIASGLGICLSGLPVETPKGKYYLVGLDLDKCVLPEPASNAPKLTPEAQSIIDSIASYWELSPSGTGVRAFFYAETLPPGRNKDGKEIYGEKRFLTVTGLGKGSLRLLKGAELQFLVQRMFGDTSRPAKKNTPLPIAQTAKTVAEMQAALNSIPANLCREDWIKAVLAVQAHGFACAEESARTWSISAGPYHPETNRNGYDAKAFDDVWRYPPHSITAGTLYFLAQKYRRREGATHGDTLNGEVFASLHKEMLKYVYPAGRWIGWRGSYWGWCGADEALTAAKLTAEKVRDLAAEEFRREPTSADTQRKLAHARQSFNLKRLDAMLICAAAEPGMHVNEMSELDADPMLLGCGNGVIDLRTGQPVIPDRNQMITKRVAADFVPDAPCPKWERFLHEVMLQDGETIDYLQKALGYTLTGSVREEVLHFCFGGGRNGKSVFANILRRLFNDYSVVAPAEMLMVRDRGNGANNDVARLVGARLLLANETRNGQAMDDLALKTLVSTETISARFLHREFFEFKPTHAIWMRGNHKPLIRDESEGAWRRIRLVPFELDLSPEQVDPHLEDTLWEEREGILTWAVQGCLLWQKEGLTSSPRIKAASAMYRKDCDLFGEFLEEICVIDKAASINQRTLWGDYKDWCEANGVREGSKKNFTRRLADRGVGAGGWQGKERLYRGIRKRTERDCVISGDPEHHVIAGSRGNPSFSPKEKSLGKKPETPPSSCDPVAAGGAS